MSLAQKARPTLFKQMVGNEAVIKSLTLVLKREDRPHAFLLTGPSGCGKTTLARIIAKKLGCYDLDLNEYNAANTRGIDTVREMVENAGIMPTSGFARVFILDECAELTAPAQEALLKIIEDTPTTTYFVLCTTSPQKLINTIRNRCATYAVELLMDEEITGLLKHIEKQFKLKLSPKTISAIAEYSNGCPRNAVILAEQVSGLAQTKALSIISSGGIIEKEESIEICRALVSKSDPEQKWKKVSKAFADLGKPDIEKLRFGILYYLMACLKNATGARADTFAAQIYLLSERTWNGGMPHLLAMLREACKA